MPAGGTRPAVRALPREGAALAPPIIRPEAPSDGPAVEALHARIFGPGRFARTAYRLREGADPLPGLCFAGLRGGDLVGSIRFSPVEADGVPFLALGPLAVDPANAGHGLGAALMRTGMDAARAEGHALVVLVGDRPYYARFGFEPVPPGRLVLPGPVDPARFLWADLVPGGRRGVHGPVRPGAWAPA